MQATQPPLRRPSLIGPMIVIGLGILFLLGNLGVTTWSIWEALLRLWPVLLIASGLEILVGRRRAIMSRRTSGPTSTAAICSLPAGCTISAYR